MNKCSVVALVVLVSTLHLSACSRQIPTGVVGEEIGEIVFIAGGPWHSEVYSINADGTDLRQVTYGGDLVITGFASWSPDGLLVIFDRSLCEYDPEYGEPMCDAGSIYAIDRYGMDERCLRPNSGASVFSPDGFQVAFVSGSDPLGLGSYLHVMNADGSEARKLSDDILDVASSYSWSPDGRWIVYVSHIGGGGTDRIFKINSDGGGRQQLTETRAAQPVWSPDGSLIAFTSRDPAWSCKIYLMNPDGSEQRQLTSFPIGFGATSPVWSPDGSNILFEVHDVQNSQRDLWVVNSDGSGQQRLTFNNARGAVWSPDGSRIAFTSDNKWRDFWQVYVMNSDGSNQVKLTDHRMENGHPAWRP